MPHILTRMSPGSPHRVEVLHPRGGECSGYLLRGGHAGQRVAVTHGLPHRHDVGATRLPLHLKGPEVAPDPAKPRLHLVHREHGPRRAHVSAVRGKV